MYFAFNFYSKLIIIYKFIIIYCYFLLMFTGWQMVLISYAKTEQTQFISPLRGAEIIKKYEI
jgi:hypothetical protein